MTQVRSLLLRHRRWAFGVSLAALALVIGAIVFSNGAKANPSAPAYELGDGAPVSSPAELNAGFRAVVKKALPAVVNISSTKVVRTADSGSPFPFDPFFRDFFFDNRSPWRFDIPRERRESGLGSGVLVTSDGYILTNHHVIDGATDIRVSLADKREFKAKIVGGDAKTDIAVLKVDETNLPALKLGDSSKIEVGDIVLAMGNPFGIGQTVTMGIVSATGRHRVLDPESYEDFIQTDAAINPGNSGGALVNLAGELIGINTAIISRSGGNQGIGFAVPSNMARHVMDQIVRDGRVVRGWLGVSIQPVDAAVAKAFGLKSAQGALVGDVAPDGPAAKAGLEKGDVILEINGAPALDVSDLRWKIASTPPKTTVKLKVFRNGKEMDIPVTLGELPDSQARARLSGRNESRPLAGVQVDELTPQLARQLGLPANTFGVVVTAVEPDAPAAQAGLRRGDVIQEVNRQRVANVAAFERAVRDSGPVVLLVNRGGSTMFLVIEER
jgi:Do/DeqQ family serine protease